MRSRVVGALLCTLSTFSPTLWAADTITPLNVKLGLWQMTVTHSMTGLPSLPADTLAKMSPQQRANFEAAMKQSGSSNATTDVHKECVTKEKLEKDLAFNENHKNCTRTVVSSSSSRLEFKLHCEEERGKTDGTFILEVVNSEATKGSMHSVSSFGGHNVNMDLTFDSKYLGSDCGDVK